MSKVHIIPLELSASRPVLDVHVPAERITLLPVEPGGQPRAEVQARRQSDELPLEVRAVDDRLLLRPSSSDRSWWPGSGVIKRMTLYVPAHVRARIEQEFGQLFAERLAGCDLDLSCNAGEIRLHDIRGRMKLVVDAGSVKGEQLAGTFDVVTNAGEARLGIVALDAGPHSVRTAMGEVKVLLAPSVQVKLDAKTSLGSARVLHPNTPTAEAVMSLSAELGAIKVKTGDEVEDVRHGDWPDWRRWWRDVAQTVTAAIDESIPRPVVNDAPPATTAAPRVPEAELRKVLELVETGKLSAPDAERLIRAMGA